MKGVDVLHSLGQRSPERRKPKRGKFVINPTPDSHEKNKKGGKGSDVRQGYNSVGGGGIKELAGLGGRGSTPPRGGSKGGVRRVGKNRWEVGYRNGGSFEPFPSSPWDVFVGSNRTKRTSGDCRRLKRVGTS